MTQSGISQAVRSLESALHGGVLLSRDRNGVKLTALGEKVAGHARRILTHVDCVRQEASAAVGIRTGKVRIASVASAAARLLPASIRAFQRQYPHIEIVLVEGTDQEVRDWVLAGIVEIGFAAVPQKGLTSRKIASDEVFLVVPKAHRLAGRSTVRLTDIKDDPFLMSQAGCEPMIRSLFRSAGIGPRIVLEVRDVSTLLALVREGVGVSLVPELAIPPGTRGIATVPLDPRRFRSLGVLLAPKSPLSPAARAFLKVARTVMTAPSSLA